MPPNLCFEKQRFLQGHPARLLQAISRPSKKNCPQPVKVDSKSQKQNETCTSREPECSGYLHGRMSCGKGRSHSKYLRT